MRRNLSSIIVVSLALMAAPVNAQSAQATLDSLSRAISDLAAKVEPAVVQIFSSSYAPPAGTAASTAGLLTQQRSTGSGVLVSSDGYIVTNAHVVRNARRIQVLVRDPGAFGSSVLKAKGHLMEAQLVGTDTETDVAVLQLDLKDTPFLPFGDSEALAKGEMVLAFGSPLGLENSVTLGVVSAVARQLRPDDPMIYVQTDAPINPGNSGGPLINSRGEIVGINTFILSQSGGNDGIGFAAPSNIVEHIYKQIRDRGSVRRSQLGANVQTITPLLALGLGLDITRGAIVSDVVAGGPAEKAGLQIGDVIVRLGDKIIENARQLEVNVYSRDPGEAVRLQVIRGADVINLESRVTERQDTMSRIASMVSPETNMLAELGIMALDVSADVARLLPPPRKLGGVLVAARVSAGAMGDNVLQPGDVIFALNNAAIVNLRQLREILGRLRSGDAVVFQVQRQGRLMYVSLSLD